MELLEENRALNQRHAANEPSILPWSSVGHDRVMLLQLFNAGVPTARMFRKIDGFVRLNLPYKSRDETVGNEPIRLHVQPEPGHQCGNPKSRLDSILLREQSRQPCDPIDAFIGEAAADDCIAI
jgi:hypothetical protein